MLANLRLPALNFLMADVGGGLGPYLATFLAQAGWTPAGVGTINTAGSIVTLALSAPSGMLLDRFPRPRLILMLACAAIMLGTLAMLPSQAFIPILLAELATLAGGALGAPAMTALTLGIVGKRRFPRQQGTNEAANHAGNVVSALAILGLSQIWTTAAPFAIITVSGLLALLVLWLIPRDCIDEQRILGQNQEESGGREPKSVGALWRDTCLLMLICAISLFHLGNAAMLPLLGQKLAAEHAGNPTQMMALCVLVAQLTMVPVAYASGWLADHTGRRNLLIAACLVLPVRGVVCALATGPYWLIPIEVLDGIGAGLIGVAAPAAIADLTYGTGRTQSAIGGQAALQGLAIAVASLGSGLLAQWAGWTVTFLTLSVPPILAALLLLRVDLGHGTQAKRDQDKPGAAASKARV